eukprot:1645702-Pyramimonas_sp.AAC.1
MAASYASYDALRCLGNRQLCLSGDQSPAVPARGARALSGALGRPSLGRRQEGQVEPRQGPRARWAAGGERR